MAITFDDLPGAKPSVAFDDIPDASHGLKFDDLPDAPSSSEPREQVEQNIESTMDGSGVVDPRKLPYNPQGKAQFFKDTGLDVLEQATSPSAISKLGAEYATDPIQRMVNTEVISHADAAKELLTQFTPLGKSPLEGAIPNLDISAPAVGLGPLGFIQALAPSTQKAVQGGINKASETLEGLASPFNIATAGLLPGASAGTQKLVSGAFALQLGASVPAKITAAQQATTPEEKGAAYTDLGLTGLMAIGALAHAQGRTDEAPKGSGRGNSATQQDIDTAIRTAPEPASNEHIPDQILDPLVQSMDTLRSADVQTPKLKEIADATLWQLKNVPQERINESRARIAQQAVQPAPTTPEATEPVQSAVPPGNDTPITKASEAKTGVPLIASVLHGTASANFSRFSDTALGSNTDANTYRSSTTARLAHSFTDDLDTAQYYANMSGRLGEGRNPRIINATVDLKNPLVIERGSEEYRKSEWYNLSDADILKKAKSDGYDGVVIKNEVDGWKMRSAEEVAQLKKDYPNGMPGGYEGSKSLKSTVVKVFNPDKISIGGQKSPIAGGRSSLFSQAAAEQGAALPDLRSDLEKAQESDADLNARTTAGPERDKAITQRRAASVAVAATHKEGDTLVTAEGDRIPLGDATERQKKSGKANHAISGKEIDAAAEIQAGGRIERKPEIAPETASVATPEPTELTPEARDIAHQSAYDLSDKIANDVAKGQHSSVVEAARDAAYRNAARSIDTTGKFSPDFMRKSAMEAAGKESGKTGVSLDAEGEDQKSLLESTPSEEPTPAESADRNEFAQKAVDVLGGLEDRDQQIVQRHTMEGHTFDEIGADLGISRQAVQKAYTKAIETMRQRMTEAGYTGGPGAMGPIEALEMAAKQKANSTSLKRSTVDLQRKLAGGEDIPVPQRANSKQLISDAEDAISKDDTLGKTTVDRVNSAEVSDQQVSPKDAAVLLVERGRLRNERDAWQERASDPHSTDMERTEARQKADEIEEQIDNIDQASRKAGTAWSDFGRLYQQVLKDDFTVDALERKAKAAKQGPLSDQDRATAKKDAADYKKLQEEHAKLREIAQEGEAHAQMSHYYEQTIKQLEKERESAPKISKPVLEIARSVLDRWKASADKSKIELRKKLANLGAAPDPTIVLHVANIMLEHIGEIGLKSAEVLKRVSDDFGDKVKPYLKNAWEKAKQLIESEKTTREVKEVVKKGVPKKEPTELDIQSRAKAESKAGEPLNPKTLDDLVRAKIKSGLHGENEVMAAVHKDIQEAYPDVTEKDVRRALVKYGSEVTAPSRDAVETRLRQLKSLVKVEEDIRNLKAGEPTWKSQIRDKRTQELRDKVAIRSELLKKVGIPETEASLASRDAAKQTALKNRIEDLDKQLRTGEKPIKGEPLKDSTKTEQLRSELQAMKDKLKEVQDAEKPKPTEQEVAAQKAQEGVDRAAAALDRQQRINSGEIKPEPHEKVQPLSAIEKELRDQTEVLKEAKKASEAKTPEEIAADKAQQAVDRAAASLDRQKRINNGEIKPEATEKRQPLSALEKELKDQTEALRKAKRDAESKSPTERYNETRMKDVQKQLDEANRRIREGDYAPKPKPIPKEKYAEVAAKEAELTAKKQEIKQNIEKLKYANRSTPQKVIDAFKNALHFLTAVKIIGHGTVGMMTHAGGLAFRPSRAAIYWRNFGRQLGLWANKAFHEQLVYKLKNDPDYAMWKKAGAAIDPDQTYTDYGLYDKWLGKLAAGGKRGFDALKFTRFELNKADWAKVPEHIKNDPEAAKETQKRIADINNKATGALTRGNDSLSQIARSDAASTAFFAPKLYASRWARVVLDPIKTANTFLDWKASSEADKYAAIKRVKNAAEFAATYIIGGLVTNQAILMATGSNQRVNFDDPTKGDWLKFKGAGKEVVADGGLLDPVRLLGQVVVGDLIKNRTENERYREGSRYEKATGDLLKYARSKFNPTFGLIVDSATRSDFQGRPLPFSNEPPKYKDQPKYNWGEWLSQQGPIPISGGVKVAYDEMRKQGLTHLQATHILKGAAVSAIGTTGIHVSEDHPKK